MSLWKDYIDLYLSGIFTPSEGKSESKYDIACLIAYGPIGAKITFARSEYSFREMNTQTLHRVQYFPTRHTYNIEQVGCTDMGGGGIFQHMRIGLLGSSKYYRDTRLVFDDSLHQYLQKTCLVKYHLIKF